MTAYRLNLLRGMAAGKTLTSYIQFELDGEVRRANECQKAIRDGLITVAATDKSDRSQVYTVYRLTDAGRKAIEDGGKDA